MTGNPGGQGWGRGRGVGAARAGRAARPGPTAGPGGAGRRRSHFLAAGPSAGGRAGPGGGTGPRLPEAGRGRFCQRSAGWERALLPPEPPVPRPVTCAAGGRCVLRAARPSLAAAGRAGGCGGGGGLASPIFSLFFSQGRTEAAGVLVVFWGLATYYVGVFCFVF